ncbi:MAG TPA: hypothetical protein VFD76_02730 [Gemmatimonadales bacterium]|nr:hypothetical protein [Gemmatimonadales bacterium]
MTRHALAVILVLLAVAGTPRAQLITIKTVPIAQGDQFDIYPSMNQGMGGVAIALPDTLLDPFRTPERGGRLTQARFFGAPTVYAISSNTGGGRTLPVTAFTPLGSWYAALSLAVQEVDPSRAPGSVLTGPPPPGVLVQAPQPIQVTQPTPQSHGNAYVFALVGKTLPEPKLSLAASFSWARLNAMDGVDLLYPGSQSIDQFSHAVDVRLGLLKQWAGDRALDAVLLHNHFGMSQDVTYLDLFWDPGTQSVLQRPRVEHELDRTDTWGLHLQYERPLTDTGWRIGWIATGNLMTHPKIPNYELMNIPRDPGRSQGYQVGVGVARTRGPATFGLDAVYEPIWSHTWAAAAAPTATSAGDTIPVGGMTIENRFHFSNFIFRMGIGRDVGIGGRTRGGTWQLGVAARTVHYWLTQRDLVQGATRAQEEWWVEWTPTWGFTLRFPELELRYSGRVTKGTGRPGTQAVTGFLADPAALRSGDLLVAPNGPLTLDGVSVVTHQVSLSLPLH